VLRSFNLFCEYASLVRFKLTLPNTPRPFNIPGGTLGAIIIALPTMAIVIFCLYYTDPFALEIGAGVIGFLFCFYQLKNMGLHNTQGIFTTVKPTKTG